MKFCYRLFVFFFSVFFAWQVVGFSQSDKQTSAIISAKGNISRLTPGSVHHTDYYQVSTRGNSVIESPDEKHTFLAVISQPSVAYFLLFIAILGIVTELSNPGFVAPGLVGFVSLLLALVGLKIMPTSWVVAVAVVILATLLAVSAMAWRSWRRPVVNSQQRLIGKRAILQIDRKHRYWVRLCGERWRCESTDQLEKGQLVEVEKCEGVTLVIKSTKKRGSL